MKAAWALPESYTALLPFVRPAPDQGDTNTCWFVASTGAMELLLNKKDGLINQKAGSVNDLAESFLIYQKNYHDPKNLSGPS
jgi:C1A family cysteine protease